MKLAKVGLLAGLALSLGFAPTSAVAQELVADSGDTGWMLAASALVLFMALPGLALYYAGRAAHVRGAVRAGMSVFAITAAISLLWIIIGYSLVFSPTGGSYIGDGFNWMLNNLSMVRGDTTVPESAFALFQMGFACVAAVLAVGAVMDRARFGWMLGFASLWSLIVYVPVAHWVWGGWLGALGVLDFSGGLVVHGAAGVSALVTAIVVGKRTIAEQAGESVANVDSVDSVDTGYTTYAPVFAIAGAALLWLGWFGLTGGSEFAATDDAVIAIVNTHLAASAAALLWALLARLLDGKVRALGLAMGALSGLATITASAGYTGPGGAILIGAIGATACFFAARILSRYVDDTASIVAVNGVGGLVGALLVAPFLLPALGGLGFEGNHTLVSQLITQLIGIAVVVIWAAIGTLICAYIAAVTGKMRAEPDAE